MSVYVVLIKELVSDYLSKDIGMNVSNLLADNDLLYYFLWSGNKSHANAGGKNFRKATHVDNSAVRIE